MNESRSATSTGPDFGARDRAIRSNTYTTVLRRDGVPHDTFAAYWRDVHGPLCSRIDGLGWYVQHHFAREHDAHLWPPIDGVAPVPGYVLDGAVEIGFLSEDDQRTFVDASSLLFSDEQNVFAETVAYDLTEGSYTYLDRQRDAIPNGADLYDRMHVHFSRRPGIDAETFGNVMSGLAAMAAGADEVVKVRLHRPAPYDNANPSPPAPNVAHEVAEERTDLAVLEIGFSDSLARRRFFAADEFLATIDDQGAVASHITAFAVAGVYTFVRDATLTTAGLRGSRVAELVLELAALNQTEPEVERLFGVR